MLLGPHSYQDELKVSKNAAVTHATDMDVLRPQGITLVKFSFQFQFSLKQWTSAIFAHAVTFN